MPDRNNDYGAQEKCNGEENGEGHFRKTREIEFKSFKHQTPSYYESENCHANPPQNSLPKSAVERPRERRLDSPGKILLMS
ncbi:MAG: hypothetical protein AMXMBFR84_33260 [Candidatus Hydrogenedentota bacterium]